MNMGEIFATGTVCGVDFTVAAGEIDFTPHAKFAGVYLKHLVKGGDTDGAISCHLIKVEPCGVLDWHGHGKELEIHEVIAGSGRCLIGDNEVEYKPGVVGVIPPNTKHKVVAGDEGICFLAKFTPALL